jgi:hypothetical protein
MSFTRRSKPTGWTRLLRIDDHSWLGLVDAVLFVGDLDGPKRQIDPDLPIGLLPCLERPYSAVLLEIEERESALSLARGSLGEVIPLRRIPHAAMSSKVDYWVQLALDWVETMPKSEVDVEILELLEHGSWPTQRARHRAKKLRSRV